MSFACKTCGNRTQRLSVAADLVRDKHGDETLVLGRMFRALAEDAPDRIGFRKTNGISVQAHGMGSDADRRP